MKKFILLLLSVLIFSCSSEESSETTGNLNIPEVFRGDWITPDEEYTAKVTQTYLEVHGVRTITSVTSEEVNGDVMYRAELSDGGELILLYGNSNLGISIFDAEGNGDFSRWFMENN